MKRLFCAGTAVGLVSLIAIAAHATDGPVAVRPSAEPGDVYEYADRFETIACKRWEVQEVDASGALTKRCNDNVAYFTADGALRRIVGKGGHTLVEFRPQAPAIPFPLAVGVKWNGTFELSTATNIVAPTIVETCVAAAYETVTVPAGTFEAFRVDCVDAWSIAFLSGTIDSTVWYAPAAKAVVKAVNSGDDDWNLELTHYTVR